MKSFILLTLFVFTAPTFSKDTAKKDKDKFLLCNERGCSCQGSKCSFVDERIIKIASTISITCPGPQSCGIKIVHALYDKYGCKSSVHKMRDLDYVVSTECLVLDANIPDQCPAKTTSEIVEKVLKICLETRKG